MCRSSKRKTTKRSDGAADAATGGRCVRRSGGRVRRRFQGAGRSRSALLDSHAHNLKWLVLVEKSEVFLCEIANCVTLRIANHHRHKHRVHIDLDHGPYLRGLLLSGNSGKCEESCGAEENSEANWSAAHLRRTRSRHAASVRNDVTRAIVILPPCRTPEKHPQNLPFRTGSFHTAFRLLSFRNLMSSAASTNNIRASQSVRAI